MQILRLKNNGSLRSLISVACILFLFSIIGVSQKAESDTKKITIFEPKTTHSYRQIFAEIKEGISSVISQTRPFTYDINRQDFPPELFETEPIVLSGKLNKKFITTIHFSASVGDNQYAKNRFVSGAMEVPIGSKTHYGVTLYFSPAKYAELSIEAFPDTKRLVFFHKSDKGALNKDSFADLKSEYPDIEIVFKDANTVDEGLGIVEREVRDYSDGTVFIFVRGFIEMSPDILLDYVVRESWDKKIPTVGNRVAFVKRGLSIGLSPDFYKMGEQIGSMWQKANSEDFNNPIIEYLEGVQWAINLRTVRLLGRERSSFDLENYKYVYKGR